MLAIIAALSLMQAGEDMITRDELAAIADCTSPAECVALIGNVRAGFPDELVVARVAMTALRHHGLEGIDALGEWVALDPDAINLARPILMHWPSQSDDEFTQAAEITARGRYGALPNLPQASLPPDTAPLLGRAFPFMTTRTLGYAGRDYFLRSYVRDLTTPPTRRRGATHQVRFDIHDAYLLADDWTRIAADRDQPSELRTAALRGLVDIGPDAHVFIHRIRGLEAGPLTEFARAARRAALDPQMAVDVAEDCRRLGVELAGSRQLHEAGSREERFHLSAMEARFLDCMTDLADFGRDAREAASLIRQFAESSDLRLQLPAVQTLGAVGDEASRPMLRRRLQDAEWQSVYAAILAMRHLRENEDSELLLEIAASHWLGAVRREAARFSRGARYGARSLALDQDYNLDRGTRDRFSEMSARVWIPGLGIETAATAPILAASSLCLSDVFSYAGNNVEGQQAEPVPPSAEGQFLEVPFADGLLRMRTGRGWLGELIWQQNQESNRKMLVRDDIVGVVVADSATLIVAAGFADSLLSQGTLYRVDWRGDDDWTVTRISTLPSMPRWLARLDEERFAVATAHGLIVFDRERIIGLGHCEPGPPAHRN